VAVLALDRRVLRTGVLLGLVVVAARAAFLAQVLHREVLPFLDVAEAIEVVGEAVAVHAEVRRDHEVPGDENHGDQSDRDPQGAEHMILHGPSRAMSAMPPFAGAKGHGARATRKLPADPPLSPQAQKRLAAWASFIWCALGKTS